jgi:hypothetical protein
MKPVFRFFFLSLIVLIFHLAGKSQPHTLLLDFSGYQQDDRLVLRWTFRSGSLCEGTRIERSADGLAFNLVGEIPGICGNPGSAFTYTFTDSLPKANALNYYRLELGNFGFTSTISVDFIKAGSNGFVVMSNNSGQTDILFQNPSGRKATAIIYSSLGKRVLELDGTGRRITLPSGKLAAGIYLLLLNFSDNTSVSGNFILP